jgi:hypothetical protein
MGRTGRGLVCGLALAVAGCGKSPTQPSQTAPPTSSLNFQVEAGQANAAFSRSYTTDTATFGAGINPSCVPNPSIAGSYCPDLLAFVRPMATGPNAELCQFHISAPRGQQLRPGTYRAARIPRDGEAEFSANCQRGGTTCGSSTAQFTLREMRTAASGVVTRLHVTWEQTCLAGTPLTTGFFGKMTGELWIVDGTNPFGAAGY